MTRTYRMSCSMTIDAVRSRRKTVTRRHHDTWKHLQPGDHLVLVEKAMGLPKGAKQVALTEAEVIDVRLEPLGNVWAEPEATVREGLAHMSPGQFITFWMAGHGHPVDTDPWDVHCVRIEWRYIDDHRRPSGA